MRRQPALPRSHLPYAPPLSKQGHVLDEDATSRSIYEPSASDTLFISESNAHQTHRASRPLPNPRRLRPTGPPLPPSLELPKPPTDLRATRKGNKVTLTWSEPALTTDHQSVRYLGPTLICRSAETDITTCANQVAIVPPPGAIPQKPNKKSQQQKPTRPPLQTYADPLPASAESDNPDAELTYAVEVLNRNARGAGLSNRVHVPAIATLPAPADLSATLNEDGVDLTWTSVAQPPAKPEVEYRYRIYRRNKSQNNEPAAQKPAGKKERNKDAIAAELPVGPPGPAHFIDPIEWEKSPVPHHRRDHHHQARKPDPARRR